MTTITAGTRFKVQDTDVDMENFIFTIDGVDGNDVIVSWDHESDKGDTMYHLDMVNHFFKKGIWVEVK